MIRIVRTYLRSTSKRTFVAFPVIVLAEQLASRRRLRPIGLPFLVWGYLQYLLGGRYRTGIGGGGPGVSGPPPEQLVTSGIYRYTRNPMYSGHVIFLWGLTLLTGSPVAATLAVGVMPWFNNRVQDDENRLRELFGAEYDAYCAQVSRWGLPPRRRVPAA